MVKRTVVDVSVKILEQETRREMGRSFTVSILSPFSCKGILSAIPQAWTMTTFEIFVKNDVQREGTEKKLRSLNKY